MGRMSDLEQHESHEATRDASRDYYYLTRTGMQVLASISKKEKQVFLSILDLVVLNNCDASVTQEQVAEISGADLSTVRRAYRSLCGRGIMVTPGHGRVYVNPDMIGKGNYRHKADNVARFKLAQSRWMESRRGGTAREHARSAELQSQGGESWVESQKNGGLVRVEKT
jgi:DNA-binding transcriptional regulator YhcF (GntR family)